MQKDNMKHFVASFCLLIVVFYGLNFDKQLNVPAEHNSNIASHSAPELFFYSADINDISIFALINESNLSLIQRLLPSTHKSPFSNIFIKKNVELVISNEISNLVGFAVRIVIHFDGTDIIQPFNSFW